MNDRTTIRLASVLMLASAACVVEDADTEGTIENRGADVDEAVDAIPAPPVFTYYIVTHIDQRKCIWPICGGVFVKEVNKKLTECADGSFAKECHVAVTDFSALNLPPSTEQKLDEAWQTSHALLRGEVFQEFDPYSGFAVDTLAASEGWVGVTGSSPKGAFQRLEDSGIVCVTFPCPSFIERLLNDGFSQFIAEVDLANSGATQDQVEAGYAELFATGILAAGEETVVYGPAGTMPGFAAHEFYTRVDGADPGEPCGPTICGAGLECCNPVCGVCVEPGDNCLLGCPDPQ